MKSKFAYILDVVRIHEGFPGLGFKRAATEANAERTMMRFALEAYRNPALIAAIDAGTITDPKIVQVFHSLPSRAVQMVCRLEARLGRHLSRARAERLVQAYLKVSGKAGGVSVRPAGVAKNSLSLTVPCRRIPLPALPAFF